VRLSQGNAYYLGANASTSGAYGAERAVAWSPGGRKLFAIGAGRVQGVTDRAAQPEGYLHPTCWAMPQKSGGMASRGRISGAGAVGSISVLAGGKNAVATVSGSGTISSAALGLILAATAGLTGSGALSASVVGRLQAAAALAGSGNATAAIAAIAAIIADVEGVGGLSGSSSAKAHMSGDIVVTGVDLTTANVGEAVWNAICESGYTYQDVMRILVAVSAGKTEIVDLGGGAATVTFRDINDTVDRVVADMVGSERSAVTLDTE